MWRPSPRARVSAGSEVSLKIMKRSSVVFFSPPQLSQSSQIKAKVFSGQAPPSTPALLGPVSVTASRSGKERSLFQDLSPIVLLLLLWRKGHGYTETLWTGLTCHSGAQCHFLAGPETRARRGLALGTLCPSCLPIPTRPLLRLARQGALRTGSHGLRLATRGAST